MGFYCDYCQMPIADCQLDRESAIRNRQLAMFWANVILTGDIVAPELFFASFLKQVGFA
jgi:hypothetical protein